MGMGIHQKGFTIVELLIVVVVIAILAAVTVVAYNGVTQRAKASAVQSAASQAMKKLATYAIENDAFPTTLDTIGINSSSGIAYQYTPNNSTDPKGYCVTTTTSGVSYYLADNFTYTTGSGNVTLTQATPAVGACPGHSTNGVTITNFASNPSVEVNSTGFSVIGSSTVARTTSTAHSGVGSAVVTLPNSAAISAAGATFMNYPDFTVALDPGTTYTGSAWVWVPTATVNVFLTIQGTGRASLANPTERTATLKNQWVRIYNTFDTGTSGTISVNILNAAATTTAGTQFWVDDIMLTKGSSPANYADGASAGWVWNGTAGNSSSKGPAL
ncbi:MAG: carbohydrate binding domain-containing protein [Candidatus Saccharimonadaceae bacterium]